MLGLSLTVGSKRPILSLPPVVIPLNGPSLFWLAAQELEDRKSPAVADGGSAAPLLDWLLVLLLRNSPHHGVGTNQRESSEKPILCSLAH
jgi:hypothetical protein